MDVPAGYGAEQGVGSCLMSFSKLKRFEQRVAAAKQEEALATATKTLRQAVKDVIPKRLKTPKRPKGRTGVGGVSRREVKALRAEAVTQLADAAGLTGLEVEIQRNALVMLKLDGLMGTEPWRAAGSAHGALVSANARLRYVENAVRLLEDLRRSRGIDASSSGTKLLEGVIDAVVLTKQP